MRHSEKWREAVQASNVKHGEARRSGNTKEYNIWCSMKQRCYDPNHKDFHLYGGRGITVCDQWINDFSTFLKDMGRCPQGMSLDRERVNEGYNHDNCRWVDDITQSNNRRDNYKILGLTLTEWSRRTGIRRGTLRARIDKYGFTPEEAVKTPLHARTNRSHYLSLRTAGMP